MKLAQDDIDMVCQPYAAQKRTKDRKRERSRKRKNKRLASLKINKRRGKMGKSH